MKWIARCIFDSDPSPLDIPVIDDEKPRIIEAAKKRRTYEVISGDEVMLIDFKHMRTFSLSEYIPPPPKPDDKEKCAGK